MSENIIIPEIEISFRDFLFKHKRNKTILILSSIAIIVQFSIFKYLYPYASYIHGDSFSYLNAADKNLSINTYLIGYSKFLRLVSVFTKPDYTLVAFQYLLIQGSVLFLLFTLFYFYKPTKTIQAVLIAFMVLNPLLLHLGNLVSSDGIFLAISCTWFALLLWIFHRPSNKVIIWHGIILFLAFTVRYNALIYPLMSLGAFCLSRLSVTKKIIGLGASIILCFLFVIFTSFQYKKLTGTWQYSPFSGWQMANNAMYTYRYVNKIDREPVPNKFIALDKKIREYFDSTRNVRKYPIEAIQASTYYMWTKKLPLYKYRDSLFETDTAASELKKWASMGPLYKEYGLYIIKNYPWHFVRYFLWPNAKKYYAPPIEYLENFNSGKPAVSEQAKRWFGYRKKEIHTRMKNDQVWVLSFYPILSGIINITMFSMLICYVLLKGWNFQKDFSKAILLGSGFWLLNAGFTIFASSAALRFQSFPIILTTTVVLLLIDWMIQFTLSYKSSSLLNIYGKKITEDDLKQAVI